MGTVHDEVRKSAGPSRNGLLGAHFPPEARERADEEQVQHHEEADPYGPEEDGKRDLHVLRRVRPQDQVVAADRDAIAVR